MSGSVVIPQPLPAMDEATEYRIRESAECYEIITSSGRSVLIFRDKNSAAHTVSLLNEAFHMGYKKGFRAGREHRS
jgi:hypothetical protein